jgi:hypothetical protein
MEETDMGSYLGVFGVLLRRETTVFCPAMVMGPEQRRGLALQALAGSETISRLAQEHEVSRKFIYQQAAKAEEALDDAFSSAQRSDDQVLFHLPVTKAWLRQMVLSLTLICHSSIRRVGELFRAVFDYPISVGAVHAILLDAVEQARSYNRQQDLSGVRIGAHDETFQSGQPVLVSELARLTVCASSVIENLNSRLRGYFFLRRHLGPDYLDLLQFFFLNHHRFLRSERWERIGKSPAELLTGQMHPHWLEMLGYTRFSRN